MGIQLRRRNLRIFLVTDLRVTDSQKLLMKRTIKKSWIIRLMNSMIEMQNKSKSVKLLPINNHSWVEVQSSLHIHHYLTKHKMNSKVTFIRGVQDSLWVGKSGFSFWKMPNFNTTLLSNSLKNRQKVSLILTLSMPWYIKLIRDILSK